MILCHTDLAKAIDKAVFPGLQGGPLEHVIAAKAVAFRQAMSPEFRRDAAQTVANAKELAAGLSSGLETQLGPTWPEGVEVSFGQSRMLERTLGRVLAGNLEAGAALRLYAKDLGIYLTVPLLEVEKAADGSRYFNTVCLASPNGEMVAHYRKLTPWPVPEKSWATPGDRGVQTYDSEYGRVGLGICFDVHTILEKYRERDLWALLYPIAWVDTEHPADWFFHKLPARVKPFKHHLIGANWSVDKPQSWRGYGFSTIIDKDGKVVSTAKSLYGSEIVYADLPVSAASAKRR
jgi:predicted amidohydrolase